jgi:hypothetical protein
VPLSSGDFHIPEEPVLTTVQRGRGKGIQPLHAGILAGKVLGEKHQLMYRAGGQLVWPPSSLLKRAFPAEEMAAKRKVSECQQSVIH